MYGCKITIESDHSSPLWIKPLYMALLRQGHNVHRASRSTGITGMKLLRLMASCLKVRKIIISHKLRENMIECIHSSHMGVEKSKNRARDIGSLQHMPKAPQCKPQRAPAITCHTWKPVASNWHRPIHLELKRLHHCSRLLQQILWDGEAIQLYCCSCLHQTHISNGEIWLYLQPSSATMDHATVHISFNALQRHEVSHIPLLAPTTRRAMASQKRLSKQLNAC